MKKKKLGIIGSGNISKYHIDALKNSNFILQAIAGSKKSVRAKELAKKYKFKSYYESPERLAIESSNFLDALVICCDIENTVKYIKLAGKKIKILSEKPVSKNHILIKQLKKYYTNVRVGYNRRFYNSVEILKNKILKEKKFIVNIELPEKILQGNKKFDRVFGNSVHIFDLMNYLFESPKIINSKFLKKKNIFFKSFNFITHQNNLINLTCNWNTPSNFKIEVFFSGEKYLLQPIELLSIFKGMKVKEPSSKIPIRQYMPIKVYQTSISMKNKMYKPGFKIQAENFYNFVIGKKNKLANLDDAYNTLSIAKKITI